MKIAMMGGWNTDSGASLHAELTGREWVKDGHELHVFTFYDYAFHGTHLTGKDESYVMRCFTVSSYQPQKLDPLPFLTKSYEIFVAEDLGMLPKNELAKIFSRIKKKAITINIIHDAALSKDPSFYQFDWDALTCFDERYRNFLIKLYDPAKIHIIPYPCHPLEKGNKEEKRKKLGLPLNKKIIFCFGPASASVAELVPSIAELKSDYPLLLLVVTQDKKSIEGFKKIKKSEILEIELRQEVPDINRLYDYLHAADLLLINKKSLPSPLVVVSSTIFQCLGSGCPIVARDSNYVECCRKEIMKFSTPEQLKKHIDSVFDRSKEYQTTLHAAEKYVKRNSAQQVGREYIKLFRSLK
jgi:hypothetical protein